MMDPYAKNPYSMQWNFGVAKQIGSSSTVTLDYVGSGTRRLDVGGDYNTALTPGPGNPQLRALYPYIAPTYYDRSMGRGNYNALQFHIRQALLEWTRIPGLLYLTRKLLTSVPTAGTVSRVSV